MLPGSGALCAPLGGPQCVTSVKAQPTRLRDCLPLPVLELGLRPSTSTDVSARPPTRPGWEPGPALGLEQTRPRSPSRPERTPPGGAQTPHLRETRPESRAVARSRLRVPLAPPAGARPRGGVPAAPSTGREGSDLLGPTRLRDMRGAALLPRGGGGVPHRLTPGRCGSRLLENQACCFFSVRSSGPHLSIDVPSFFSSPLWRLVWGRGRGHPQSGQVQVSAWDCLLGHR